jgi:hypothetical protein
MLLLVWQGWRKRGRVLANLRAQGGGAVKLTVRVMAGLAGFTILSRMGVLGGLPVVAHDATAQPGNLIVTVAALHAGTSRGGCKSAAVKIAQFTYWMRDYRCLAPRALAAVTVGSRIRLQGQVSPVGIVVERYQWGDLPEFDLFRPLDGQ